jgi:hypothetical protein
MEQGSRNDGGNDWGNDREARLNELFRDYRAACPVPDAGENFMPELWARINARGASTNWFGRVAGGLVAAATVASLILGTMISTVDPPSAFFDATFVEALRADHASALEPLHLDRIAELEP